MKKSELKQLIKEEIQNILGEGRLDKFNIGDVVRVNSREGYKSLIGLEGVVVGKDLKKGRLDIDFKKKLTGEDSDGEYETYTTHRLNGLIDTETGLSFFDRGWISSKIDPRFDIRNLDKI
jgi:hypothetical protein